MKSTATAARRSRKSRSSSSLVLSPSVRHRKASAFEGVRVTAATSVPSPKLPHQTVRLVPARSGDHAAIHRLLLSIFHGPSAAEFHAQLDEPLYEPTDRLLVKSGDRVVAHLRITKRLIRFGSLTIPAAGFMDLGTSHEFRSRGFATSLLDAGQQQAAAEGALVGLARTTAPDLFLRQGWSVCGRHSFSVAGPRQILASFCSRFPYDDPQRMDDDHLSPAMLTPAPAPSVVRPLRRIELPAVMRLYDLMFARGYGALVRSEVWWEWLMSRGAFDRAYVAVVPAGAENAASAIVADAALRRAADAGGRYSPLESVVGCVFVKEGRIVELLYAPGQEREARRLAARVCADGVERNLASVRLDAPPADPLHQQWADAGGTTHRGATHQGETCMARVFDPLAMLRLLSDTLLARAKAADLPRPFSLGLDVFHHDADIAQCRHEDVRSYRLVVGRRTVKLTSRHPGRSYLSLRRRDLTPLLLGHWDVTQALATGRLRASTRLAQEAAAILFPPIPWYRPPLDDLLV
jgi:GNAT acetyltransferase-like protein/sterol carrier protein